MTIFRPCIDLHAGQVKQIVGGTLAADEGAHVIMLGPGNEAAAAEALAAWPGHLQVGGGINDRNAAEWFAKGASKVGLSGPPLSSIPGGIAYPAEVLEDPLANATLFVGARSGHHHILPLPRGQVQPGASGCCAGGARRRQGASSHRPELSAATAGRGREHGGRRG